MKKKLILGVVTLLFVPLFFSCKNNDVDVKLLENTEWRHDKSGRKLYFYPDGKTMHVRHITASDITQEYIYSYTIQDRKITMQFKGPLSVSVDPSTHSIKLKNNELILDFSNGCYGFKKEVYVFKKTVE